MDESGDEEATEHGPSGRRGRTTGGVSSEDPELVVPRLARALLQYLCFVILLITWDPFAFLWPPELWMTMVTLPLDVVMNLVMFVPFGFLLGASLGSSQDSRPRWVRALIVLAVGLCFSTVIEIGQFFIAIRHPTPPDVATNSIGAWLGAEVFFRLRRWLHARFRTWTSSTIHGTILSVHFLALLPICIVASMRRDHRSVIALLLVAAAVPALAAAWRRSLHEHLSLRFLVISTTGWFVVVLVPSMMTKAYVAPAVAAVLGTMTWLLARRGPLPSSEVGDPGVPMSTIVLFFLYLLLAAFWPVPFDPVGWKSMIPLSSLSFVLFQIEVMDHVESGLAFVTGGYMLAEVLSAEGRVKSRIVAIVVVLALILRIGIEIVRGFHPIHNASLMQVVLCVVGAWLGARFSMMLHELSAQERGVDSG